MAAGDPIYRLMRLESDAGVAQSYANKTAFQAAGWDLTFKDGSGVTISPVPTWTIAVVANGLHLVGILTEPAYESVGGWFADITVPAGYYTPESYLDGDGVQYSNTDLLAQILSSLGSTSGTGGARVTDTLEDWVHGDSFLLSDIISVEACTKIGEVDLTGVTVRAGWKKAYPAAESAATELFTGTVVVLDVSARTFTVSVPTFPVAAALATGEESVPYVLDITISKASKVYTAKRYFQSIVWQADTRNT